MKTKALFVAQHWGPDCFGSEAGGQSHRRRSARMVGGAFTAVPSGRPPVSSTPPRACKRRMAKGQEDSRILLARAHTPCVSAGPAARAFSAVQGLRDGLQTPLPRRQFARRSFEWRVGSPCERNHSRLATIRLAGPGMRRWWTLRKPAWFSQPAYSGSL